MNPVLTTTIKATLPELVKKYGQPKYKHHRVEIWVFNDRNTRMKAEKQLLNLGIIAKVRSAYKPLLNTLMEELDIEHTNLVRLEVKYPVNDHCPPNRFALEAYPLGGMLGSEKISFVANRSRSLTYEIEAILQTGEKITRNVLAPSAVKKSATYERYLSPTGWIRIEDPQGNRFVDQRINTDYEQVFDTVMQAISLNSWPCESFEELNIKVKGPMFDEKLPYAHEHISLSEALHEDFYFTIQEWFKYQAGKAPHDRSFRFGQIIPDITSQIGDYDICVRQDPYILTNREMPRQVLEKTQEPLSSSQISSELGDIKGERLSALSVAGRSVQAVYHQGADQPVLISGGQHANELSGIVGALRHAKVLAEHSESHFVISPLENPDGYETFLRLSQTNPTHMHHRR
ncbi:hypothetical protein ACLKMH_01710 [Psychromonas sp. KJ10-10]|uniref:hypothetical protein n=1 Tax=Psychromonas sp. KJ10-10 TaxID=3391823 RepID=UPI0039B5B88F